ncbi:MAG: universal stress protein [Anaerolineae bacterium]
MTEEQSLTSMPEAVLDFHRARRKAALQELIARLTGESIDLLSYEEVRQKLRASSQRDRGMRDIPLDAIVGSVGRYTDFTRTFLPRQDDSMHRWARVKVASQRLEGLPPIEVYQIGDVYFVKDGNHRVSVAREIGASHIQAYVTEVQTQVPMESDMRPDDLILKAEYADFLRWSDLRSVLPGVELILTAPGKYEDLKEHISVHRYYMGIDDDRPVSQKEAVIHWYETVYQPTVDAINRLDVLCDFPDRTETDLYLWTAEHRGDLQHALGWEIEPVAAAEDLAVEFGSRPDRVLARVGERLVSILTPESLGVATAPPGEWRERLLVRRGRDPGHLFHNVLVTLDGRESGWQALREAVEIACLEHGRILGLHIVPSEAHQETSATLEIKETFDRYCEQAGIPGELAIGTGTIAHEVSLRARWADLVVAPLSYPPGQDPIAKLRSGFRTLLVRSPCPVLAVPKPIFPLSSALVAYDGSPKGKEALFVATYLAVGHPDLSLVVLTVHSDDAAAARILGDAEAYLSEYGLKATYLNLDGDHPAETIRATADAYDSRLIIMGGYGYGPILEVMLGSTVNEVLRTSRRPVLICR